MTHITNLTSILDAGRIEADDSLGERPAVDISSVQVRQARHGARVDDDGPRVSSYVPFFLSPNASIWDNIRSHTVDPRLSSEALAWHTYDFVILVSTIGVVRSTVAGAEAETAVDAESPAREPRTVITDRDAATALTRYGTTAGETERMLRALHADDSPAELDHAEFLVRDFVPFESISLVGVANDKVRAQVKSIVAPADHRPKVAVYPPWFQPVAAAS